MKPCATTGCTNLANRLQPAVGEMRGTHGQDGHATHGQDARATLHAGGVSK